MNRFFKELKTYVWKSRAAFEVTSPEDHIIQMKRYHADSSKWLQKEYQLDSDGALSASDERILVWQACW